MQPSKSCVFARLLGSKILQKGLYLLVSMRQTKNKTKKIMQTFQNQKSKPCNIVFAAGLAFFALAARIPSAQYQMVRNASGSDKACAEKLVLAAPCSLTACGLGLKKSN